MSLRVVKSEKRGWMALWQLQRIPRRITQALDATDCQQDRREAPWMETHNMDTHIHPCGCFPAVFWCLFHLFLSLSLFFQFYCPFLFIWLSFLQFSQLVPCLPFVTLYFYHSAYPSGSERGGHRQVAYAPSLGSLCEPFSILGHGQSSLAREKKIYRRRNNPNFYPHSLSPSFSHLTLFNQRESSVLLSVLLIFFFLFLSLPHIKATLPLDLTHCWLCKISVCLAETEVFPRCSWFWLFFSGDTLHWSILWNSVQNMKAAKNISHLLPAYLLSRQNKI